MSILLTPELEQDIEQIAQQEQRTPLEIIEEAVTLYRESRAKKSDASFLLSMAGQGRSNETDISERVKDILTAELDPYTGWRAKTPPNDPT
ncbi:MAG: hypothetical protein OEU26_23210 [Candidatus Tectomicrobia bacterium]|nr:hypothetical protein [Candidatus Tectomicrobia bacterium]